MTQMIQRQQAVANVRDLLERSRSQLEMALPRHLSADKMIRVALTTIQTTPKLLECSPQSLLAAIMESSQLGLEPDGVTGQAYLVPYKQTCKLIVGYKGLLDLARRSGQVLSIYAHCVYEGDEFHYELGLRPDLRHVPAAGERGDLTHVYAVARLKEGEPVFEVMDRSQVDAIRDRSRAGRDGPWVTDYPEMARKTVLRRVCKFLPLTLSPELNRAVAVDERAEAGVDIPTPVEVVEVVEPGNGKSGLDLLADGLQEEVEEVEEDLGTLAEEVTRTAAILPAEDEPEPPPKAKKPRKMTKAKVAAYRKRIGNNPKIPPFDVYIDIEEHLGAALADLTTDREHDLEKLLQGMGI